jgi:hypothetical protein
VVLACNTGTSEIQVNIYHKGKQKEIYTGEILYWCPDKPRISILRKDIFIKKIINSKLTICTLEIQVEIYHRGNRIEIYTGEISLIALINLVSSFFLSLNLSLSDQ